MKKNILISLLIASIASALIAKETVEVPVQVEFANKLVDVFGGDDEILSKSELVRVLDFIQAHLPEQTTPTTMTNRLNRQNVVNNSARGDMTSERFSLREDIPEHIVSNFIEKYDLNADNYVTKIELANALKNVIGTPRDRADTRNANIAKK